MRSILFHFYLGIISTLTIFSFALNPVLADTLGPNHVSSAPTNDGANRQGVVSSPMTSSPEQAQETPSGKFIQSLGDRAIKVMASNELSPSQRSQQYRAILNKSFDIPTIGHFVLGRSWNGATPEQQQKYLKLFEQVVLKIYGDKLSFYSGENFKVVSVRQESDKDSVVSSNVVHTSGSPPTKVDWRVRQVGDKLSVIDVSVAGVSQSITQRDEYASIIQRDNGKIDMLLEDMRQQVQSPQQQTAIDPN